MTKAIIIGAGVGGLVTAAKLAKSGFEVIVLESHVDPGGCAATFFHKGHRFDAGATLAGGFAPGAPMDILGKYFDIEWEAQPATIAMQVHLPEVPIINRWSDQERWQHERRSIFGNGAEPFWHWQETTADKMWDLASQMPPWPPQSIADFLGLINTGWNWSKGQSSGSLAKTILDAFTATSKRLVAQTELLRLYVDAQLLISAQTTSQHANALYSAVALDLARQGVAHIPGGMGSIAEKLARSVQRYGGQINYRQTVTEVHRLNHQQYKVRTKRGRSFITDNVIFNLPPWNIASLLGDAAPHRLQRLPKQPENGWGAFVVYASIPDEIVPVDFPLHHQVVITEPLGEGNTIFLSLSPSWDQGRAPHGRRAVTISTHTRLANWWNLHEQDPDGYEIQKALYTDQITNTVEQILPGFRSNANPIMPGTPVTFQRFTQRAWGWVGGFPQTSLFNTWGPHLAPGLWMVGDSIFPGQSVPAVGLGGLRVAQSILVSTKKSRSEFQIPRKALNNTKVDST
jgi:C-3',4' desaturase CrtD